MIVALLGDTHLSMRNGSNHFSQHANRFFRELFYPYLIEHGIKHVIQTGDLMDNRTSMSVKAFHACKHEWFDPLVENNIHMWTLLGNHDICFKSTLTPNSPELFLKEYVNNITVIKEPTVLSFDQGASLTTVAMVPWICDENVEAVYEFLKPDKIADLCVGHFEINGFQMQRGVASHGGMPRELFSKFEATLSGHYHTRSYDEYNRIQYVGTPYEITFADMHDPRGFMTFDTVTRKFEFIQNPYTMFDRIVYNEGWTGDLSGLAGKIVKLVVEKKTDLYQFDRFVDSVKLAGVYELQVIENFNTSLSMVDENIQVENSQQIIYHYVDNLTTSVDKERLKQYMSGLYNESLYV